MIEKPKFASTATLERFAGYKRRADLDYFYKQNHVV